MLFSLGSVTSEVMTDPPLLPLRPPELWGSGGPADTQRDTHFLCAMPPTTENYPVCVCVEDTERVCVCLT